MVSAIVHLPWTWHPLRWLSMFRLARETFRSFSALQHLGIPLTMASFRCIRHGNRHISTFTKLIQISMRCEDHSIELYTISLYKSSGLIFSGISDKYMPRSYLALAATRTCASAIATIVREQCVGILRASARKRTK